MVAITLRADLTRGLNNGELDANFLNLKTAVEAAALSAAWASVTGTPTTLSGYGITDALPLSGGTLTGNLNFTGSNLRITGDFGSASRIFVQSTYNPNAATYFGLLPNGGTKATRFEAYGGSDPNNASVLYFTNTGTLSQIQSTAIGTGPVQAFRLLIGSVEVFRATTGNNFLINTVTDDGVNKLQVNGSVAISGNTALHASNYSSYALPLSGGNVSYIGLNNANAINFRGAGTGTYNTSWITSSLTENTWEAPLTTDASGGAKVPFMLTWRGGYASQGGLKLTGSASGELGGYTILHGGNFGGYALPLTGGVLSGLLSINPGSGTYATSLSLGPSSTYNITVMTNIGGGGGYMGGTVVGDSAIFSSASTGGLTVGSHNGAWIRFGNNGSLSMSASPTVVGNAILHAGNYTNYLNFIAKSTPGTDVNTWVTPGFYRVQNVEANRPGNYGQLLTMYAGSDTITQIYGDYGTGSLQTRSGNPSNVGGSGAWTPWRTILDNSNYFNFALPLSGGALTGAITTYYTTSLPVYNGNWSGSNYWGIGSTGTAHVVRIGEITGGGWATQSSDITLQIGAYTALHTGNYANWASPNWYQGWVTSPGYDANTIAPSRSGFTYANNAPFSGPLVHFDAASYGLQFNAAYSSGGSALAFRTRNGDTMIWNSWQTILNSGNWTNYINPLLKGGSSSYYQAGTWIEFGATQANPFGLYFPSSGAGTHIAPQTDSYGSFRISGYRNTYAGMFFDNPAGTDAGWMTNGNDTGFYTHSYGWKYLHSSGNFYIFTGTYGGGTQCTALHSGNYTSYAPAAVSNSGSMSANLAGNGRALGTTYTNSSGKPRVVYVGGVNAANSYTTVSIDGSVKMVINGYGSSNGTCFIVPNGSTYLLSSGAMSLQYWYEFS